MKQRDLILKAIEMVENTEQAYRETEANAATNFDQRTSARRAFQAAEREFSWQWKNVKAVLSLPDRLEKWLNANSEMRSMEVMEGESLRWHVRLKEIVFTEAGEVSVAQCEAGTYEAALDGALRMVEQGDTERHGIL